jgi:hypothetical protein
MGRETGLVGLSGKVKTSNIEHPTSNIEFLNPQFA